MCLAPRRVRAERSLRGAATDLAERAGIPPSRSAANSRWIAYVTPLSGRTAPRRGIVRCEQAGRRGRNQVVGSGPSARRPRAVPGASPTRAEAGRSRVWRRWPMPPGATTVRRPSSHRLLSCQQPQEGGLPGAVVPDDPDPFARPDGERHAVEHPAVAVALGHLGKSDLGRGGRRGGGGGVDGSTVQEQSFAGRAGTGGEQRERRMPADEYKARRDDPSRRWRRGGFGPARPSRRHSRRCRVRPDPGRRQAPVRPLAIC